MIELTITFPSFAKCTIDPKGMEEFLAREGYDWKEFSMTLARLLSENFPSKVIIGAILADMNKGFYELVGLRDDNEPHWDAMTPGSILGSVGWPIP